MISLKALLVAVVLSAAVWTGHETALAQQELPSTVFGSISDADGEVPAGLPVVAYIGETVCSLEDDVTVLTGKGEAQVAVYIVDVRSEVQVEGCGNSDADVRIQIDGRFADGTVRWRAGPVQFNITFGNAPTVPIPTFTPTATVANTATPVPETATITPGVSSATPSSGGAATPDQTASATEAAEGTATAEPSASPTLAGGVTTNASAGDAGDGGDDDGGGIPIWVFGLIIVAVIAIVGGGLGYFLSRSPAEEVLLPPEDDL